MNVIYQAEHEAGLAERIRTGRVTVASCAELSAPFEISKTSRATAGVDDLDLHFMKTVLASSGWNLNDDVFDATELWMARLTPVHKPINLEHVGADIIGTTIASKAVDSEGNVIPEDSTIDSLPAKYHILTEDVLYKVWENPDRHDRMERILAEISQGGWFVSMECLFKGFDYCLKDKTGQTKVVARNSETAFLSKHLKAYGGDGVYDGTTVGRLFRNITFSGKALVRKPANPDSVILQDEPPEKSEALELAIAAYFDDEVTAAEHAIFKSQVEHDIHQFFAHT